MTPLPTPIAVYWSPGSDPPIGRDGPGWWVRFENADGDWESVFIPADTPTTGSTE